MKSSNLDLKNLIQGFTLSCQTEGKSSRTIEWYVSFLERFYRFLRENNLPVDVADIDKDHIRSFIRYLQTEAVVPRKNIRLSPATVQGYVRTLKAFFAWTVREEYLISNPMTRVPVPRGPTKVVNILTTEQIISLLDVCRRSNGNGHRNLTMQLLMLDSGIRVSEMVGMEPEDVNLAEGYITIRNGKGGKERVIPIGSLVQKSLWKYINHFRPQPLIHQVTRLFLSDDGLPLTKSGVQQMLRRYGKLAGLAGVRCSPHTFRHTFARNYLLNGGDIFSLQKILGHSSLASVRVYLNLFSSDLKAQHRRFSPVDNLAQNRAIYPLFR